MILNDKICFFDIDGVLNTSADWKYPFTLRDNLCLAFCAYLKKYKLSPVIISSWRLGYYSTNNKKNAPYIKELERLFKDNGILISGATPNLNGRTRDQEISRYLYYYPCSKYIIIDDDKDEYNQITNKNFFVNSDKGFEETKELEKLSKTLFI